MYETKDHVSIRITEKLQELPDSSYKPSIFRVSDDLRRVDEKLYEPKVVAVGHFHHSEDRIQKMEQHKFRYLKHLLKRRGESSVDEDVMAIRSLEEKARGCYAEPIYLNRDNFVHMLLLDGIFIIELIRKYLFYEFREKDDMIFQHEQVYSQLRHDLMLVENQVPFFVLEKLFNMTKSESGDDNILYLIQGAFADYISPWPDASKITEVSMENIDHLLGLVYRIWCSSFAKMTSNRPFEAAIDCTTKLQEAGIEFFLNYTACNFLDIEFNQGVMKIPRFDVSDATESVFSNLIAYEHFSTNHTKYATDYAFFLHCLINSSSDVEILRQRGIVTNLLGDDEMVYRMFNRLGRNLLISSDFHYNDVFYKVNVHCRRPWNIWKAHLRHNYFNDLRQNYFESPWKYVSFSAALMLLLFTLTQTVFSVLSYTKS
ncbi:hypothetical protein BUALT_Bualt08G0112400 [Buddleja alternifolia]|uniref:Uncharacterized protein n=1 Tax=Buddleja alternifolia TaxID=168488 RepID=A0AAV6X700_9LAMI|nr:hypothetical protein BUALT_Bualt08G0112400 [Buddleja alternifolia]